MSDLKARLKAIADDAMGMEPGDRHTVQEGIDRIEQLEAIAAAVVEWDRVAIIYRDHGILSDAHECDRLVGTIKDLARRALVRHKMPEHKEGRRTYDDPGDYPDPPDIRYDREYD